MISIASFYTWCTIAKKAERLTAYKRTSTHIICIHSYGFMTLMNKHKHYNGSSFDGNFGSFSQQRPTIYSLFLLHEQMDRVLYTLFLMGCFHLCSHKNKNKIMHTIELSRTWVRVIHQLLVLYWFYIYSTCESTPMIYMYFNVGMHNTAWLHYMNDETVYAMCIVWIPFFFIAQFHLVCKFRVYETHFFSRLIIIRCIEVIKRFESFKQMGYI